MTSSLRNSIHRRNHKERSQLAHRSKLGILEKHADYVKRARDYHSKQDRLTRLKQKAAEKNKDEFYFSMRNQKTKNGVHIKDRGNVALPTDIVKVLKTQDENYIRTIRAAGLKKIDHLKTQLTSLVDLVKPDIREHDTHEARHGANEEELQILARAGIVSKDSRDVKTRKNRQAPSHIVFVDSREEVGKYKRARVSASVPTSTQALDLGWKSVDDRKKIRTTPPVSSNSSGIDTINETLLVGPAGLGGTNRHQLLKELSARLARDTQLRYAEREFELQRSMMSKGGRKKIQDVERTEGEVDNDAENEDEFDARRGKRKRLVQKVNEKTYKPRVYKWRLERKR